MASGAFQGFKIIVFKDFNLFHLFREGAVITLILGPREITPVFPATGLLELLPSLMLDIREDQEIGKIKTSWG